MGCQQPCQHLPFGFCGIVTTSQRALVCHISKNAQQVSMTVNLNIVRLTTREGRGQIWHTVCQHPCQHPLYVCVAHCSRLSRCSSLSESIAASFVVLCCDFQLSTANDMRLGLKVLKCKIAVVTSIQCVYTHDRGSVVRFGKNGNATVYNAQSALVCRNG
jgi:hypothetical protein